MNTALVNLIIGIVIIVAAMLVFWPDRGLINYFKKKKLDNSRILLEDSLKHIYDYENRKVDCTIDSIAGCLSIGSEVAHNIAHKLMNLGLIHPLKRSISLTESGRSYALKIIRIHRLWEMYLADQTGVDEKEWHTQAEKIEHILSEADAEELASRIGNPIFDPHGDPIPSSEGNILGDRGKPLTSFSEKESVKIVHIEDEPSAVYSKLVDAGLYVDQNVFIENIANDAIELNIGGRLKTITLPEASKISAEISFESQEKITASQSTLAEVKVGDSVIVESISKQIRGQQRRRLMDLGIVPGTIIVPIMESVGKDPVAYNIRGALVALRKLQSNQIFIRQDS
ncbi:MAG: FeoA domain-containing protein [Bacteroidetes bacterium]|nr:FeoA domain-containing protein [Bacteroidota bacterium]MBU1680292.1 FeoA domain-containing protein [Bacteroidota bacterium]MBU2505755.1 FeoA domain-containing protein [Bacteroidota bacterium]